MKATTDVRNNLSVRERLIVAFDFKPNLFVNCGRKWVHREIWRLIRELAKTGVTVKMNSALRALGYEIIDEVHQRGLSFFADLKLADIPETLTIDGTLLSEARPEFVTVYCATGRPSMTALREALPKTEVLGVTVLTSMNEIESATVFNTTVGDSVLTLTTQGVLSEIDGFICSPKEIPLVRGTVTNRHTINTPGVRPSWSVIEGDDQNPDRVMTPLKAIRRGADRIIVGRPITKAPSPYDAVMRTLEEIDLALNGQ